MSSTHDILLDKNAFTTAASEMSALHRRTETLKTTLEEMYRELASAIDTPAGRQVELTAGNILIKPIDDLLAVFNHVSTTLDTIIGTGYYKDVFIKYEELNQSISG